MTTILLTGWELKSQGHLTGQVFDTDRQPLYGVAVLLKGTSKGAITDSTGSFLFETESLPPFTLSFQYLGYETQNITLESYPVIPLSVTLNNDLLLSEVVINARRREETAQHVPIPISIVTGNQIESTGSFNVNRLKELIPTLQLYSSNPRNTGVNIRGLGSPFGLTNDGLDPGVGYYVDGVYHARPAATQLDFLDIEQIEVLRGTQGTLYGKNTTSGAFQITTRKPAFTPGANLEVSFGNFGFIQAKGSVTGPLIKDKLAARISFSGTQRNGTVYNVAKDEHVNDINNLGAIGQLLYTPNNKMRFILSGDATGQYPNGYAQVVAGVVQTKRSAYRQFNSIISDLNYSLPNQDPFERVIDHDTPWRSLNEIGGVSLNADFEIGPGKLTSTTAWRYWNWGPSNDRDFTGLQALAKSQNPTKHRNWSQEFRYAGDFFNNVSGVVGLFLIDQDVKTTGTEESGNAQWRFSQNNTSELWKTPGLFEGFGINTNSSIQSLSAAAFAKIDWQFLKNWHIMPGIRFNYDEKDVRYDRKTYGGLETSDPALQALKNAVYTDQFFEAAADETNLTYNLTLSYRNSKNLNLYATYSTSYKPVGVNVAGLPVINGEVAVELGTIKPEYVQHIEVGLKSTPAQGLILNLTVFNTDIDDYQANVQSPQLGVNRGYIANAEKVNSKGVELDLQYKLSQHFIFTSALAYTDARYVRFTNAPLPLEEVGLTVEGTQVAFKDISGGKLPGISDWAGSFGAEYISATRTFLNQNGKFFIGVDAFFRSDFSSSPSPSAYLNVDGYVLTNARLGYRANAGLSISIWARNLLNQNYHEQLLVAGGSAGHYASVLGDPRTYGVTIGYALKL